MTVEFSVGVETLKKLIAEFSPLGELSNEAQTRFSFVDRFLKDCLGWSSAGAVKVEVHERGDRTDYECGQPRQLIVEAKKASAPFRFPPRGPRSGQKQRIRSISEFDADLGEAIDLQPEIRATRKDQNLRDQEEARCARAGTRKSRSSGSSSSLTPA